MLITVVYFGVNSTEKSVVYPQLIHTSVISTGLGENQTESGLLTSYGQTTPNLTQKSCVNFSNLNLNQSRNFGLGATSVQ